MMGGGFRVYSRNTTPLRAPVVPELFTEAQFDPLSVDLMMTPSTELTATKVLFPKVTPILKVARVPKCRGACCLQFVLRLVRLFLNAIVQ